MDVQGRVALRRSSILREPYARQAPPEERPRRRRDCSPAPDAGVSACSQLTPALDETQSPVPVLNSRLRSANEASVSGSPLRPANTRWDRRPED